jgi:hypothetical protein
MDIVTANMLLMLIPQYVGRVAVTYVQKTAVSVATVKAQTMLIKLRR